MKSKRGKPRRLPRRPSAPVDLRAFPGVRAREKLNRLLRAHDPETAKKAASAITADDLPILRQIAQDRAVGVGEPGVRKHAIALLGRFATPEDINVLADVARFDPDPGLRTEALISLGKSRVRLAEPVLREALKSRDPVESTAAAKALRMLTEAPAAEPRRRMRPKPSRTRGDTSAHR